MQEQLPRGVSRNPSIETHRSLMMGFASLYPSYLVSELIQFIL
jgi:hypothetical protein